MGIWVQPNVTGVDYNKQASRRLGDCMSERSEDNRTGVARGKRSQGREELRLDAVRLIRHVARFVGC